MSEVRGGLIPTLPVDLVQFNATAGDKDVTIEWKASKETDNKYFILDRSSDGGKNWEFFTTVNSVGDGTDHVYSFTDDSPYPATMMAYRLTQVTNNGEQNELRSTSTFFWGSEFVAMYPVPVKDNLNIKMMKGSTLPVHVSIYDMSGNLIREADGQDLTLEDMVLDLSDLSSGRYFVVCSDRAGNIVKKAILKEQN